MNDTLFAQLQLNGSDNITDVGGLTETIQGIDIREPYLKRIGNYMYMYVGVAPDKATDLRVKVSDISVCSESLETPHSDIGGIFVGLDTSGNYKFDVYGVGDKSVSTEFREAPSINIVNTSIKGNKSKAGNSPEIDGFSIALQGGNYIKPADSETATNRGVSGVALTRITRLAFHKGTENRCYGTSLPTSAEPGEVFFLIAAQ